MDLVEVLAGLQRFREHFVSGHTDDALALFELVDRERAKLAARVTDVRRVYVAVEDVEDFLAALAFFRRARHAPETMNVRGSEERESVVDGERNSGLDLTLDILER